MVISRTGSQATDKGIPLHFFILTPYLANFKPALAQGFHLQFRMSLLLL